MMKECSLKNILSYVRVCYIAFLSDPKIIWGIWVDFFSNLRIRPSLEEYGTHLPIKLVQTNLKPIAFTNLHVHM